MICTFGLGAAYESVKLYAGCAEGIKMGKKKKKQELYEYQYTTPNKQVVKELLPAVKKPAGTSEYQGKITWGGILGVFGAWKLLGTLEMLSLANPFSIIRNVVIYGAILGIGIYQFVKGKNYVNGRILKMVRSHVSEQCS